MKERKGNVYKFRLDQIPAQDILEVVGPHNSTSTELELAITRLHAGQVIEQNSPGKETVVVILGGACAVTVEGGSDWHGLGKRKDVFTGRATAVYIPRDTGYQIMAESDDLEVAILRSPTEERGETYVVQPEEIAVETRGSSNWCREVHTIIDNGRPAGKLLIGETFNEPGGWSSYPPHKHDVHNPPDETQLEEVYHFRMLPEQGFGVQRIYSEVHDLDETFTVYHTDTVFIPFGYHTVGAAAGYRLYYLWALAGNGRVLKWRQDPLHEWVTTEGVE